MSAAFLLQILIPLGLALAIAIPLGLSMANAFDHKPSLLDPLFRPVERLVLSLVGIQGEAPAMDWKRYTVAVLTSNLLMLLLIFAVLLAQGVLPLNPQGFGGLEPMLAFNTAASFITNTNWQAYTGEATLSNFSQMAAITFPQFTSAATGFVVAVAFIRGILGRPHLGNFYEDLVRFLVRILLPLSVLAALFFCFQGSPQSLDGAVKVTGPQGTAQTLVVGPVASLASIKHLGTNGGGFYGQNSAHPLENPTPLTNVAQFLLLAILPTALIFTFGRMLGNQRQAWVVFGGMALMFLVFLGTLSWAETAGNPLLPFAGGNMEGKEVRFGQAQTALFTAATCAFTTGTVNCMHDSLTPLGGFVPLGEMMLNNVFGGKGVGFMNYLLYGLLAVFLTGLMVGRTPEFLGKKVERAEISLASIAILLHPLIILVPTAWAVMAPYGLSSLTNPGSHGLTEILYAYTSGAANNGSAFAGLTANTPWYNVSIGVVMLLGRYVSIIALMAIAGSLMRKKRVPVGPGTLRTDTALFGALWLATILIVGALTFFPVVALGPVAEHLAMLAGKAF
ncbi:MAG: potassium transporter ATPase [Cyanobacteria bacterium RYN_339]|nr:potassium transporter ATPase [Cyanobacteria bacterium RYN_339]